MNDFFDSTDLQAIDRWMQEHFGIQGETVDSFVIRTGMAADSPRGYVQRMRAALAWFEPQLTNNTRAAYDEIKLIVQDIDEKTALIRWCIPGKPIDLPKPWTADDDRSCEQSLVLFKQLLSLIRLEEPLNAFKKSQSDRASKPRKLDQRACERIAKRYWDAKRNGSVFGLVKALAAEYDVSKTTISTITRKYAPN